jgi:hypothetical protein
MLKMFLATTLLLSAATPAFATGTAAASADHSSVRSSQSVYRSERVIFVRNSDGTTSEQNIITVYYVFGYE